MSDDVEEETISQVNHGNQEAKSKSSIKIGSLLLLALVLLVGLSLQTESGDIKRTAFTYSATLKKDISEFTYSATPLKKDVSEFSASKSFNSSSSMVVSKQDDFTQFSCAPWLESPDQRRVLFMRCTGWEGFYNGTYLTYSKKNTPEQKELFHPHRGGENFVYAATDWALQQNGFLVDTTEDVLEDFAPEELAQYHRIFMNGVAWPKHLDNHPEILCKIRGLHFWGNFKPTPEEPWDQRQVLSPYREQYGTFLGYFAHSLVQKPIHTPNPRREKHGFIIGRRPHCIQKEDHKVLRALIDDGYTLHSTCFDPNCRIPALTRIKQGIKCDKTCGGLPKEVIFHGVMAPGEYGELMSQMAFLIGMGDPIVSPSPFVGWAHGAAWLNPFKKNREQKVRAKQALQEFPLRLQDPDPVAWSLQHWPVAMLGAPYVYNIDLDNVTSVVEAANWAVQNRFSSYAPPDFTPQAMVARTCSIMADDAICTCPNPTFGKKKYKLGQGPASNLDCHGSSYIQHLEQIKDDEVQS